MTDEAKPVELEPSINDDVLVAVKDLAVEECINQQEVIELNQKESSQDLSIEMVKICKF